jgi:dTDP-4-amino-4,6-dideoxy-D-galactose acyltransferase
MNYDLLEWDSALFGFGVARVSSDRPSVAQVDETLGCLKRSGARLVYWPVAQALPEDAVTRWGGFLADLRTTFAIDFDTLPPEALLPSVPIEPYVPSMPKTDLVALAIQSGEYSRFAVDPKVPRDKFEALYMAWINNSVTKELAREVLVLPVGSRLAGMVTLGDKAGRGDIGLIAVDTAFRGRRYGEALTRAAQAWFVANGYRYGQVVTQGRNIAACNLYRKCGYSVETVEHFYHFWL